MNYCQRSAGLLEELKRSDFLPPYNTEQIRLALQETNLHYRELTTLAKAAQRQRRPAAADDDDDDAAAASSVELSIRPAMILHDRAIKRNKRCLLAYHAYRADKLRQLRWETGGVIPPGVRPLLSESEMDFWREYDKLIGRYAAAIDCDLMANLSPPEDDYVEVRVVEEGLGDITTEFGGSVRLDLGTTHHLRRVDVEHLIRQGVLEQLSGEEN
mmetsp:Transcript_20619/g.25496  ORF Transcript_20619/g.25496 Transcript_20619/m.25496 type:complete len:214 (-) Transcript_20619:208-849(-)|eukprot:CAMPEP_0172504036 /NCGR_PEP_ID=MMETSP1066-20121228/174773_1 /TAXON_ID=671091 /ORGANISM="Coscinodiscus wailesii, Strain CCMP2513" /LENGTH=213 /DNA_ID=CAMNT_0013280029 /DNA_START=144 /DNA_END=785 /DNA_ORIENTATION=-